jgi:hypothetical protein
MSSMIHNDITDLKIDGEMSQNVRENYFDS